MKNPGIERMFSDFLGSVKDNISLEMADQVMGRIEAAELPGGNAQLKAQIQLLILDAIEFGIQLGGMEWKEGE